MPDSRRSFFRMIGRRAAGVSGPLILGAAQKSGNANPIPGGGDYKYEWKEIRKMPRDHFIPGKFVCPHGACFDHAGHIFVVERVEIGRVTKLRHVA